MSLTSRQPRAHATSPDFGGGTGGTDGGARARSTKQKCDADFRKDHAQTIIQSATTIHPDIIALITSRFNVPPRHRSHGLFCIRLHFVRKERIGVEKICAQRFLTIGEGARCHVFRGKSLLFRGKSLRRQKFRDDRKHDDNLAARLASKAVGRAGRHRPGALRTCHAARTPLVNVCS